MGHDDSFDRFNDQFRETDEERHERWAAQRGRAAKRIEEESIGPFPAEPAPGTPEAVAAAAETIRSLSPEPERPAHTPGPWVADGATDGEFRYHQIDAVVGEAEQELRARRGMLLPKTICDSSNRDTDVSPEEDAANAELIARAPLLLTENALLRSTLKSETSLKEGYRQSRDEERLSKEEAQRQRDAATCLLECAEGAIRSLTSQRDGLADALEVLTAMYVKGSFIATITPPHRGPSATKPDNEAASRSECWAAWDTAIAALRAAGRL